MYSGGAQTAPPSLASLVFPGSCCSGGLPASKPSHLGRKAPQPPPVSLWAKAAISSAHLVSDRPHLRLRQPKSVHVPDELVPPPNGRKISCNPPDGKSAGTRLVRMCSPSYSTMSAVRQNCSRFKL